MKTSPENKDCDLNPYRLLPWILILTSLSGAINVYTVKVFGKAVSHHTGNISNIAIKLCEKNPLIHRLLVVIICFFVGSLVAGFLFHHKNMHYKKTYILTLIFIGIALIILSFINKATLDTYFLPFFIGLQNGIYIKYKNTAVRTSHITGYLTDAGFNLGMFFKGQTSSIKKSIFFIISILFFMIGGIASYFIIENFQKPLLLYGVLYIFSGIYYKSVIR